MPDVEPPVPMLDLSGQFRDLEAEWLAAIRETGGLGSFILGPNVTALEQEVAHYVDTRHAVGVANGTDALLLSLRALNIGHGDEVITTPFTFFATTEVITAVGATPVFVDIEERGFTIDVQQIRDRISDKTRAILPVHLFGYPVCMNEVMTVAQEYGLAVIEDCAQAFGATNQKKRVGSFGETGCFSFYPTKVLGGYGDGGLVTTNSDEIADMLHRLRNHGSTAPFMYDTVGYNSRLDEIQAALLRIKLRNIESILQGRRRVADAYDKELDGLELQVPTRPADGDHVFNLYTVRSQHRDRICAALKEGRIGFSVCYPLPLHLQKVYEPLGYQPGDLPASERLSNEVLSLPIFPEMTDQQIKRVCDVIQSAL